MMTFFIISMLAQTQRMVYGLTEIPMAIISQTLQQTTIVMVFGSTETLLTTH